MILYGLFFLLGLLFGYCYGKHKGMLKGREEGKVEVVIDLRQRSLEDGICFLCKHSSIQDKDTSCT